MSVLWAIPSDHSKLVRFPMTASFHNPEKFAFAKGYVDGGLLGERSAVEAGRDYPSMSSGERDAYCQGTIDGAAGDPFRLNLGAVLA
jgi:hypothetical protein